MHFIAQGLNAENGNRLKAELDSFNFLSQISIQVKHPAWANAALKKDPKLNKHFLEASPDAIALGIVTDVVYEAICKEADLFSEFNSTPDNNLAIQEKIAKYRSSLPKEQLEFIEDGEFCFYGNTLSEKIKARGFSSLLNLFLHKLLSLISEKSKTKGWWEGDYSSIKLVDSENAFQHAIKQLQSNNIAKKIKDTLLFEVWSVLSSSLERDTSTADNWSVNSAIDSALKINISIHYTEKRYVNLPCLAMIHI